MLNRAIPAAVLAAVVLWAAVSVAQPPPRALGDAVRAIPSLRASGLGRGPHAIPIIVNGARILLLGEVRSAGDRRRAEATLRSLPGMLSVTKQLRVAGQK